MKEDLLKQALFYAESMGLAVFPVNKDKSPATKHGYKDATKDPKTISKMKWVYGIGAIPSSGGYIVLDVDVETLPDKAKSLPETRRSQGNPKKFGHLWYKWSGNDVGRRIKIIEGLDILYSRGYVIMPPSLHPSGVNYAWVNDAPIASLTQEQLDIIFIPDKPIKSVIYTTGSDPCAGSSKLDIKDCLSSAAKGKRHDVMKDKVAHWAKLNYSLDDLEKWMIDHLLDDDFSENEILDMIVWARKHVSKEPTKEDVLVFIERIKSLGLDIYNGVGLEHDYVFSSPNMNLLPMGQISLVYGKSNSGKSVLSYHMAFSAATGKPMFVENGIPYFTPQKKFRVVYIDSENSKSGLTSILKSEERMLGIRYPSLMDTNPVLIVPTSEFDLDEIVRYIFKMKPSPEIIFFDSLNSLVGAFNDELGAQKIFDDALFPLRNKLGCTIVALHNASQKSGDYYDDKSGYGPLGSSKFMSLPDTGMQVHFLADDDATRRLYISKSRGPQRGQAFNFSINSEYIGYSIGFVHEKPPVTDEAINLILTLNVEDYSGTTSLADDVRKTLEKDYNMPTRDRFREIVSAWVKSNTVPKRGRAKYTLKNNEKE